MDTVHIKSLDGLKKSPKKRKRRFISISSGIIMLKQKIVSERHLETAIVELYNRYLSSGIIIIGVRKKISTRSIVDLLVVNLPKNKLYVIELKYRPARMKDIYQLKRYKVDLLKLDKYKNFNIISQLITYNHRTEEISVFIF